MQYVAKNLDKDNCDPIDVCRDCHGPPPPEGDDGLDNCWAVTNFKKYYASNYYSLSGATNMKAEIYKNGPIGCGIDATDGLEKYMGGIYSEKKSGPVSTMRFQLLVGASMPQLILSTGLAETLGVPTGVNRASSE